jgi:hypothetical protein
VLLEVARQRLDFGVRRRFDVRHHLLHDFAQVPVSPHAPDHAVYERSPAFRGMHGGVDQVVALDAVTHRQLRAFGIALGQVARLDSGGQDAREHRAMGAFRP